MLTRPYLLGLRNKVKRKILFLSRDHGGVQAILPVIKTIKELPEFQPIVLAFPESSYLYTRDGIEVVSMNKGVKSFLSLDLFNDIIREYMPDLIVTGTSVASPEEISAPEQMLIVAAKRKGIPSLSILDYWGRYMDRFSDDGMTIKEEYLPDCICVIDPLCKEDLASLGVNRDSIVVTHNPYFDGIVGMADDPYYGLAAGIEPEKKNILYASQPLQEYKLEDKLGYTQQTLFHLLTEEVSQWEDSSPKHIIVWIHPKENQERWEDWAIRVPSSLSVQLTRKGLNSGSIFSQVAFLATSHSSVVYEALYYGTPCLSIQPGGTAERDQLITNKLGLSLPLYSREEFRQILRHTDFLLLRESLKEKRSQMCANNLFFSDGKATRRVLDVIRQMVH